MIPDHSYREFRNNGYGRLASLIGSRPVSAFALVALAATVAALVGEGWLWKAAIVFWSWLLLAGAVALGWVLRARTQNGG